MTLTILSAAREVNSVEEPTMETLAKAISSGSLRGARGNSGVILSQLFRGFTKAIKYSTEIDIELLAEADELTEEQKTDLSTTVKDSTSADHGITIELIQKMVAWDKHRRILKDWQWNVMNEIISGKKTLNDRLAWGCKQNLKTLKQHGFTEE